MSPTQHGPPPFQDPLETRLRQRIDDLLEEREKLRRRIAGLVKANRRLNERAKSVKLWKHRAMRK